MGWGFVWLLLILKIPLFGLLWIVWWAIKDAPEPEPKVDPEGGSNHPRKPRPIAPSHPRRGPHGDSGAARPQPPPRTRPAPTHARVERD